MSEEDCMNTTVIAHNGIDDPWNKSKINRTESMSLKIIRWHKLIILFNYHIWDAENFNQL